ncbi:hypothetical protein Hokovirus_4_76 [Hokovirus HKV1]|uniref:Uncharacterized protein n=1 Tax=Hokovirus HKV1 TaxID=1977638 RepID=A0A1V0SHA6_9VIRU|nr:hypothetical protein Hokovirus_4_76 [Hokovirus HKV1]
METLIFIDWDDTLFPTTWLTKNNININDKKYTKFFTLLDEIIDNFFTLIITTGKIFIVTNATLNWIKISSNILPKTLQHLKNIKIISAKQTYQYTYPNNVHLWKKLCFKKIANKHMQQNKINNIISIGDAMYEYNALINLYFSSHKKYLKAIKFIQYSEYEHIIEQITILCQNIKNIINHKQHLDLTFNKNDKKNENIY